MFSSCVGSNNKECLVSLVFIDKAAKQYVLKWQLSYKKQALLSLVEKHNVHFAIHCLSSNILHKFLKNVFH